LEFAKEKSHVVARQEGLPVTKNGPHSKPSDKRKRVEKRGRDEEQDDDEDRQPSKDARLVINMTPHRILFAQNLPSEITQQSLTTVFQHIPGFREVRIVPGNRGMAFIEFETEVQSGMALRQLNGFQLTATQVLNLTYSS
jgi:U2 small nuclear ribonucleoprotein B''